MKHFVFKLCFVLVLLIIISSCNGKENETPKPQNEIPEALKDENFELKRYKSRDNDLANQLYDGLVKKTPELQKLENEIITYYPKDSIGEFHTFDLKSKDYYRSTKNITDAIRDSLTKNKMLELIKKSNDNYAIKTKQLNALLTTIDKKESTIEDYHNVVKIVLTLPLIEKYQNENLPTEDKYRNIIKKQDSIIAEMQKLLSKQ